MLDNNIIYEITRQFSNPEVIKSEFHEITDLVTKHLKQKYIHQLEVAVHNHHDHCVKHPNKEVVLLQACRPFFTNHHSIIDSLINISQIYNTMNNIKTEYIAQSRQISPPYSNSSSSADNSIHADGIYDLDPECSLQNTISVSSNKSMEISPIIILAIAFIILIKL